MKKIKKRKKKKMLIKPRCWLVPILRAKGSRRIENKKKKLQKELCRKEINNEM
jgi:hypothetical protein